MVSFCLIQNVCSVHHIKMVSISSSPFCIENEICVMTWQLNFTISAVVRLTEWPSIVVSIIYSWLYLNFWSRFVRFFCLFKYLIGILINFIIICSELHFYLRYFDLILTNKFYTMFLIKIWTIKVCFAWIVFSIQNITLLRENRRLITWIVFTSSFTPFVSYWPCSFPNHENNLTWLSRLTYKLILLTRNI